MNIRAFEFESSLKRNLLIGMAVGLICLGAQYINGDSYHTEFWSTWLLNSVYFTGISFTAVFFLAGMIVGFGGWMTTIRRIWEAMGMFMLIGMVLLSLLVIGLWGHLHHLYHWNTVGITDPSQPHYDKILAGKAAFLNPFWYSLAAIGFVAAWYFLATKIRNISLAQDAHETSDFKAYKKSRNWAAIYLPVAGFLSPMFFWLLTMSVEPHWYSTMYAWYSMVSVWLACLSLTMLIIIYLKSKGYMEYVTKEHLHDVGKFMFGITVFWMYLWFDQFMLIWYANNGEETIYFKERMEHYPVLFWGNLLINFVSPFFILMRNDNKRKFGTLTIAAVLIFFGHWWDGFQMIKPGARVSAFEAQHIEGGHGHDTHGADTHGAATHGADTHGAAADTHGAATHRADTHGAVTHGAAADTHGAATHGAAADTHVKSDTHTSKPAAPKDVAKIVASADHGPKEGAVAANHAEPTKKAVETVEASIIPKDAGYESVYSTATKSDKTKPHGGHPGPKEFQVGYTIPGFLDIGAFLGFLSLFLFVFFTYLSKAALVPKNDPFLDESLHHSTGAHIDDEMGGHDDHGHH
jgi:hypothetical protein